MLYGSLIKQVQVQDLCGICHVKALAVCASYVVACIALLYMKIFVYFIKQACLLAIVSKWGAFYG
jgi:hypothetical protein